MKTNGESSETPAAEAAPTTRGVRVAEKREAERVRPCPDCRGTGKAECPAFDEGVAECASCEGSGVATSAETHAQIWFLEEANRQQKEEIQRLRQESQEKSERWAKDGSRIEELEQQLKQAREDNQRVVCTYCGNIQTHPADAQRFELMANHMLQCERHPMNRVWEIVEEKTRILGQQVAELQSQLEQRTGGILNRCDCGHLREWHRGGNCTAVGCPCTAAA